MIYGASGYGIGESVLNGWTIEKLRDLVDGYVDLSNYKTENDIDDYEREISANYGLMAVLSDYVRKKYNKCLEVYNAEYENYLIVEPVLLWEINDKDFTSKADVIKVFKEITNGLGVESVSPYNVCFTWCG